MQEIFLEHKNLPMRCYQDIVDTKMGMILALHENIALYLVTVLQFILIWGIKAIN